MNACALGLSGVLFAFKVLMTAYATGPQLYVYYRLYGTGILTTIIISVMGIPVPSKYVYWAELLLIQMVSVNRQKPKSGDERQLPYYLSI